MATTTIMVIREPAPPAAGVDVGPTAEGNVAPQPAEHPRAALAPDLAWLNRQLEWEDTLERLRARHREMAALNALQDSTARASLRGAGEGT